MAVVDASVVLATFLPDDPHHDASRAWLQGVIEAGDQFQAPAIVLSEVAAPLGRAYNQPRLAAQIVATLMAAPFARLVPVTVQLAESAALMAARHGIRGCDAVYVALAAALDDELVTLDAQQGERCRAVVPSRRP